MDEVKFCKKCRLNKKENDNIQGAYLFYWDDNNYTCPDCGGELIDTAINSDECWDLIEISNTLEFFEAMLELKEKDPIEYQLKLSQFRNQISQQEQAKKQSLSSNQPKCPRCKSTAITAGQRGYSLIWGFFGSGNTVNRCSNCGHKWKP